MSSVSKDVVPPFAQLSLKPTKSKSRHASTSSSTSSIASQRIPGLPLSYQSYSHASENAIIDDDDDVARDTLTPLVSPNLLATSVENNPQGRLLPSLSTISLLSLSRDMELPSPNEHIKRKSISRNTSFSRSTPFQIHQQRHQQYYAAHSRRTSMQQPIPINNASDFPPETPSFGPTSLASSPSGFILSQQQLPNSLQQQRHAFPGLMRNNSGIGIAPQLSLGSMSPLLDPVQGEQVPMTPLMLSNSPSEIDDVRDDIE